MMLALDIGNTNVKTGTFLNDSLSDFRIFSDENSFYSYLGTNPPDKVAISSVVPSKTKKLLQVLGLKFKIKPFIIKYDSRFNLKLGCENPNTLGVDRICAAEGAFHLFRKSEHYKSYTENVFILAIDFGTASTINIIKYPGEFIGGLIAPGISLMFESLKDKTAQLPLVKVDDYKDLIANNTNSSIASGVVTSVIGMIEKTITHLKKDKSAKEVFVYITGGNANKIMPHLNLEFTYEGGLVLYGINALYNLNKIL